MSAAVVVGVGGTGAVSANMSAGTTTQIGSLASVPGPNWGIVDREVIRNGDAYLRTGPTLATANGLVTPPLGEGSLGLRTGSTGDKAAYGNQVVFFGDLVSSLTSLGFSVFTTAENNSLGARNMPSIVVEIDPNLAALAGVDQTSMIYTPINGTANRWTTFDATDSTQGRFWGLTGAAGAATGCAFNGSLCTWDRIQEVLADSDGVAATIRTLQITKNRDQAFSGAVDALRVRGNVYDFEPLGVLVTP